jgi:spore maturation protein CgeB
MVHEWSDPRLVWAIGRQRARRGDFRLLFHDTHHRAVSAPQDLAAYDLSCYDGVLAFGEVLRELYQRRGWASHAWTWHEAADTRVFRPRLAAEQWDLVWVGNWGDGEREREILEFLIEPVHALGLRARLYGVRYPDSALRKLADAQIEYGGWIANFRVPAVFGSATATVHVPRRFYRDELPGIPTIRIFEALACRIPLVSAPWKDAEGLFQPGDYLVANNGAEMRAHLRRLVQDPVLAWGVAERGYRTVLARHTCAHRVDELLGICGKLRAGARAAA